MIAHRNSRKKAIFALLIVPLLSSMPALGAPPPGTPEVTNTYCGTWNNGTGICDDYNFAHDATSASEWVRSSYLFEMHNTTTITLTLEWEVHEFNRTAIGLDDMDLGAGFDANNSGAPVDYIRNYLGHTNGQGLQVRQLILNEFSAAVVELVNDTYNGTADVESQIVNQVSIEGQNIQCSDDMNTDSIDEVFGLPNNAFQPPLCVRSVAQIQVGNDLFGLSNSEIDIERAFRGLLTMGASVNSNFTLITRPGHRSTFELSPPNYATFSAVGGNGVLLPQQQGNVQYNSATWMTDGFSLQGDGNTLTNASITSIFRNTTTRAVSIDTTTDHGITILAEVDLRDATNSRLKADMDIHYLPRSVLDNWGFTLGNGNIDLPWITSDGIRMAYEYGLLDLEDFSDMIPLRDVESAVFNASGTELVMDPVTWKQPDQSGGLNFTHTPLGTCSELVVVSHCLSGANAMNGTFPVTLSTSSQPFAADPLEKLTGLISGKSGLENVTSIPKEDISALLSVLVYEYKLDTSFITESLPDWLPPAVIEITILLPDWIASDGDDPRIIKLRATTEGGDLVPLAITGPNPYHRRWSKPICEVSAVCSESSPDLICKADWKSCINIHGKLNLPEFEIHEWSQEIELTVEGELAIEIYRIEVPQMLIEGYGVTIETIPADLIRHIVAYGDDQEGGLNGLVGKTIDVPLGDKTHQLELSNNGLQAFANSLAGWMNEQVASSQQSDERLSVDFTSLRFSASVDWMERPYNGIIDDDEPITIILKLAKTTITGKYVDGMVSINSAPAQGAIPAIVNGLLDAFEIRDAAESDGVFTLPPDPFVVDVYPIDESQDLDKETDSNLDGYPGNDPDIEIRLSVVMELTMPRGLVVEFTSALGRDEQTTLAGDRQHILYRVPLCTAESTNDCGSEKDEISLQFTVGYGFLMQELMPYLIGLLVVIFLLFYLRSKRKKRKREEKESKLTQVRAVSVNTHAVERELLGLPPMAGAGGANGPDGAGGASDIDWMAGLDLESEDW